MMQKTFLLLTFFATLVLTSVNTNVNSQTRESRSYGQIKNRDGRIIKSDESIFPLNDQGKILFSEVVKTKELISADKLYDIIYEWAISNKKVFRRSSSEKASSFSNTFLGTNNSTLQNIDFLYFNDTSPLKIANKESKKFNINVVYKYFDGGISSQIGIMYIEYNLIIKIKDGKYKYDISNFTYTNYSTKGTATGKEYPIRGMRDTGACKSKGNLEETFDCKTNSLRVFYPNLYYDVNELTKNLKTYIENNTEEDNNW